MSDEPVHDWSQATMTELVDNIETTHHAYLKRELPHLSALMEKVKGIHRKQHPELDELQSVFERMKSNIEPHLAKEEDVIFPQCRQWELAAESLKLRPTELAEEVNKMEVDHERCDAVLRKMRELTNNYIPPSDACSSYQALLKGLIDLEADLNQHIYKENHALHPRLQMLVEQSSGL